MMGVILRVSPTVPELDCASQGFHVKHVDTELSVMLRHVDSDARLAGRGESGLSSYDV